MGKRSYLGGEVTPLYLLLPLVGLEVVAVVMVVVGTPSRVEASRSGMRGEKAFVENVHALSNVVARRYNRSPWNKSIQAPVGSLLWLVGVVTTHQFGLRGSLFKFQDGSFDRRGGRVGC